MNIYNTTLKLKGSNTKLDRMTLSYRVGTAITMSYAKNWVFTWNNPNIFPEELEDKLRPLVNYYIFQTEEGQLRTQHFQGYCQFIDKKRLTALKKIIPQAHWEMARGNAKQNKDYCTKEPRVGGPWEFGEPITVGQRVDLEKFRDAILEGKKDSELLEEFPRQCFAYQRVISWVRGTRMVPRTEKPTVRALWGPSGTGKTRQAVDHAGSDATYMVSKPDNGRPLWWDGYDSTVHKSVVLDDFYGWLPWSFLLQLLDRYPFQVEVKGGKIHFNSPFIFITSNTEPKTWYKNIPNDDPTPLLRRIDEIKHVTN